MATKTISLELDAYEKLRRAKRNDRESFSSVVRRAVWPDDSKTAGHLSASMKKRMNEGLELASEEVLSALDRAQEEPRVSEREWS